jgi:hypothetical protein
MTTTPYQSTIVKGLQRVRYFQRQLLTVEDMHDEQHYLLEKLRRHNRFLHGWGVVCGCSVTAPTAQQSPWLVTVSCGYVLTPQGDEVWIPEAYPIDLSVGPPQMGSDAPCSCTPSPTTTGSTIYLAVRYVTCKARPIRVHPAGCGCEEAGCEFSRVRDDFEFGVLSSLPTCQTQANSANQVWLKELTDWAAKGGGRQNPQPVPTCPPACDDPWVVVATIKLPAQTSALIPQESISYADRRVVPTLSHPVVPQYLEQV